MTANGHRRRLRALLGLTVASSVVSAVLAAPVALAAPAAHAPPTALAPTTAAAAGGPVVVTGPGGPDAASAAVRAAGGTVVQALPLVSGVVAELPAGTVLPGWTIAADRPLTVAAKKDKGDTTPAPTVPTGPSDGPATTARQTLGLTPGSPSGAGVTVAVVDTGVADSPDLAGRIRHVDVTSRKLADDAGDGYGHGTFMAGLVAGDGTASGGRYAGAAPKANLLDVRVAADDGSTSLVSVLRGLQVVSASADELDIRVLNLSLSSGSPLPYQVDPLTQALEGLWRQGITVVTAAGNDGAAPGGVSSPGLDPTLLTAGALDEAATAARGDDTVADYSSRGPAASGQAGTAKPDVVAPGSHLISLRAPGSTVDAANPTSRVGDAYFRGTGTSMSTALVSGVVADLLSARSDLSPDQVKALLTGTAYRNDALTSAAGAGAGGVDAAAALAAPTPTDTGTAVDPTQAPDPSTLSAGEVKQWDRFAAALIDGDRSGAFAAWQKLSPAARSWVGRSWVALSPEARSWVARSWVGRSWVGADGTADEWLARSWVARSWVARSWVARSWVARSWVGRSWVDDEWSGRSWVGRSWVARSWVGRSWVGRSWVARSWVGRSWVDDDWAARSWVGRSWIGRSWVDDEWAGRSWVARSWTARSWTTDSWS